MIVFHRKGIVDDKNEIRYSYAKALIELFHRRINTKTFALTLKFANFFFDMRSGNGNVTFGVNGAVAANREQQNTF